VTGVRLILADDHRLFAEGISGLLGESYDVLRIVEDGRALLEAVEELRPDVVVADISMPELNGVECVRELSESSPDLRVVLLTMHRDVHLAVSAMRAGAAGYLLKNGGAAEVLRALEVVREGEKYIAAELREEVEAELANSQRTTLDLTPRQVEIVRLLVEGLSAKEIAARLSLSRRTVEYHKYQAMERLGVGTSAELISLALKRGISPL
jgi:DNA-binding NarL/FixJ family response regulator